MTISNLEHQYGDMTNFQWSNPKFELHPISPIAERSRISVYCRIFIQAYGMGSGVQRLRFRMRHSPAPRARADALSGPRRNLFLRRHILRGAVERRGAKLLLKRLQKVPPKKRITQVYIRTQTPT